MKLIRGIRKPGAPPMKVIPDKRRSKMDKDALQVALGMESEIPCLHCHHDLAEHLLPYQVNEDESYVEYGCTHVDEDGGCCKCESFT
jgi:hypothetical protein